MYRFNHADPAFVRALEEVFSTRQSLCYFDHPDFLPLMRQLHLANELQGLLVTFDHNRSRYDAHYHYVGEPFTAAQQRALSNGVLPHRVYALDTHPGWECDDFEVLERAATLEDLLALALRIARRMSSDGPLAQVCGPISSGGYGNVPDNLWKFHRTIQRLAGRERAIVFDQMPFEPVMHALHDRWKADGGEGYWNDVLERFYLPLFESGLVRTVCFMQGWETSIGAQWEHQQAKRLKLDIRYLPERYASVTVPLSMKNYALSY